ncbi:metallophosphoesterase family protein [Fuchsiella alkaliacetigena]|uniref:metallophosphoesterase family protein n=1 Tax=Fuchsiella alkaliacetigena TaxID=957042 RepID=UPI00200B0972|nr:metallophosphoesterase family protein [Fuchsiella alkaliacetigena]MCK8824959.1 serine/threonine protein phosphatase [Fuchsiella alkaliacetigena]
MNITILVKELLDFRKNINRKGRLLSIGDIHGNFTALIKLLSQVNFNPFFDKLIIHGDFIDRGENSRKVVKFLKRLSMFKSVQVLKGNHEQLAINFLDRKDLDGSDFLDYGGDKTAQSYGQQVRTFDQAMKLLNHQEFVQDVNWFKTLPTKLETEKYIFVHAGLRPCVDKEEQQEEDMLWIKDDFIEADYDFGKKVVAGHNPQDEVVFRKNSILIDTGSSLAGGQLSCVDLTNQKIYVA